MNILQIFGIGLVIAALAVILGGIKSEYAMLLSVCGGVMLLVSVLPGLKQLMDNITETAKKADINTTYVAIVIKASGIACVSSICSSVCRDMGQTAVAVKMELAGRIAIILTALPAINALLSLIERMV